MSRDDVKSILGFTVLCFLLSSCLITELIQPDKVDTGEEFEISISVVDSTADANPWRGTLSIMMPLDWSFISGSYTGSLGQGEIDLRDNWLSNVDNQQVSKTDSVRAPSAGMKWIDLITDASYGVDSTPVRHTAKIVLKAGENTGNFGLGYLVSKDAFIFASDLLGFWQDGAADSLFNQRIEVSEILRTSQAGDLHKDQDFLHVYPNPGQGSFTASISDLAGVSEYQLSVYDLRGREMSSGKTSSSNFKFDLREHPVGAYLVVVSRPGFSKSELIYLRRK